MSDDNGFFHRMCKEAADELASGEEGTAWREASTNVLLLACFGFLFNHLAHKLMRPLWLAAGAISTGVVGFLINLALG